MRKVRLDQALVERGLCPSREKAKRAILAGQVRACGQVVCKPGGLIQPDDPLTLAAPERYVSRGGYKLEHGLRHFEIKVEGVTAIDLGASTGGFTDCLLQHGAARVYAVDVGKGQLTWKLRCDARVTVMEQINARFLTRRDFPPDFAGAGLIVADCSFISLQKILPPAVALLADCGRILALVKPQFEAGKAEAGRGKGVIRDPAIHARVLKELQTFVSDTVGLRWTGETASPLLGPAGNKEFLVLLEKKPEQLGRIGLLANFDKPTSASVVREAAERIARAGRAVAAEIQTAQMASLKCETFADTSALARQTDLLLVFGGDGTMLRVVRETYGSGTPILGVNMGRLGFLTALSAKDIAAGLEKLWRNDFIIESRPLMEATGQCQGQHIRMSALNDIVISRGAVSRLIELDVSVNDKAVTRYRGDGLIVSTPTGSTAYSLSAGGPIISPSAEVFAITPICPHALSNRAVIINLNSVVAVKLLSKEMETIIAADGQIQANLSAGDTVIIRRGRRMARLLHPGETSFFEAVRQKLHWRGSSV